MLWPDAIELLDKSSPSHPLGLVGYVMDECRVMYSSIANDASILDIWTEAYIQVFIALYHIPAKPNHRLHTLLQDFGRGLTAQDRKILAYNTTWAILGYTDGQPSKSLELLSLVKKLDTTEPLRQASRDHIWGPLEVSSEPVRKVKPSPPPPRLVKAIVDRKRR